MRGKGGKRKSKCVRTAEKRKWHYLIPIRKLQIRPRPLFLPSFNVPSYCDSLVRASSCVPDIFNKSFPPITLLPASTTGGDDVHCCSLPLSPIFPGSNGCPTLLLPLLSPSPQSNVNQNGYRSGDLRRDNARSSVRILCTDESRLDGPQPHLQAHRDRRLRPRLELLLPLAPLSPGAASV